MILCRSVAAIVSCFFIIVAAVIVSVLGILSSFVCYVVLSRVSSHIAIMQVHIYK